MTLPAPTESPNKAGLWDLAPTQPHSWVGDHLLTTTTFLIAKSSQISNSISSGQFVHVGISQIDVICTKRLNFN